MDEQVVTQSPDILGGVPVFAGTRVPVQNLIDYLAQGESINDFLDDFPSVRKEQVLRFLARSGAMAITFANENSH